MYKFRKAFLICLSVILAMNVIFPVSAAPTPVMELSFDGKSYEAGEIATAEIIVYNASYNVLGFSLEYGDNVTPVDENGNSSDIGDCLVRMDDVMYSGKGIYNILSCDVTDENIKTTVYVNPNTTDEAVSENSVIVGDGGRKVASLSFMMTKDGVPDVNFATIEGDTDFDSVSFFMMNNGTQPEGSSVRVTYSEDQTVSDKKPEDEKLPDDNKTDDKPLKAPDENEDIIGAVIPESEPEISYAEDSDIPDIMHEPGQDEDMITEVEGDDISAANEELTPLQRILGITILGIALGAVSGVVMKQFIAGHKKDMDNIRDNLRD